MRIKQFNKDFTSYNGCGACIKPRISFTEKQPKSGRADNETES